MIRHVIMWQFRENTEAEMHQFLDALRALDGQIPEILRMEVGVNQKPGNSHHACLIADFADWEALERYRSDPRHVAASKLCQAIRTQRCAVDFEV